MDEEAELLNWVAKSHSWKLAFLVGTVASGSQDIWGELEYRCDRPLLEYKIAEKRSRRNNMHRLGKMFKPQTLLTRYG